MIGKETPEQTIDNSIYKYFVGIKFFNTPRAYFFGLTDDEPFALKEKVVVETMRGLELGEVAIEPITMDKYESELGLKPVLRKANDIDVKIYESNKKDAVSALEISKTEAEKLKLDMNFISCEYTLDKTKVILSYVGLPLCCSSFLNEFDGISINRAKNQMLAINIPKLSGHCGKLICCLKYEDDIYSEERKKYPELGTKLFIDKTEYTVTSVNIISSVVKIENEEDVKFLPMEDLNKQARFKKRFENEKK